MEKTHIASDETLRRIAAALEGQVPVTYGFDLDMTNGDPGTCLTYLGDSSGFEPAKMDYTTGSFLWGSWADAFFVPRPCMLTFGGKVAYYLDPNDYSRKADGAASDAASIDFGGNAMMEWPVIWVKRTFTSAHYRVLVSNQQRDPDFKCYSNLNASGDIVGFYTPCYFGSNDSSNRLRSISGQANYVLQTAQTEATHAHANGTGWYTETMADRMLINDLLVLMGKTLDTQKAFGRGVNGASAAIATGTMDAKGLFFGASGNATGVKVFGMENYWGNIWRRIAGWMLVSGVQKVKMCEGTQDGSTASAYNFTGEGYVALDSATPGGTSGGYISAWKPTKYGLLPLTGSGSSTTYGCDGLWFNNASAIYAFCGGGWSYGAPVGAFCATLSYGPGGAYAGVGAAPSYR